MIIRNTFIMLSALFTVTLLGSCAEVIQTQRSKSFQTELRELSLQARAEYNSDPKLSLLLEKTPLIENISIRHMSNQAVPTDREREAILYDDEVSKKYYRRALEVFKRYNPNIIAIYSNVHFREKSIMALLYSRKIGYGRANLLRLQSYQLFLNDIQRIAGQQKRIAANNSLSRSIQNQKLIDAGLKMMTQSRRSTTTHRINTTCQFIGNRVHCF